MISFENLAHSVSKVMSDEHGYGPALRAVDDSLAKFKMGNASHSPFCFFLFTERNLPAADYLDLYLIHCPLSGKELRVEAYRALLDAQKAGKVRTVGVSN